MGSLRVVCPSKSKVLIKYVNILEHISRNFFFDYRLLCFLSCEIEYLSDKMSLSLTRYLTNRIQVRPAEKLIRESAAIAAL